METHVAGTLAQFGISPVVAKTLSPAALDFIVATISTREISETLAKNKIDGDVEKEIRALLQRISMRTFLLNLRANIFRGTYRNCRIRMDIKLHTRAALNVNDAYFVMELSTQNETKIIRISPKMLAKLIEDVSCAARLMRNPQIAA
ncbi:unnamed protein product [Caenorhabditis bovis]|uniref:COMM domain-containing protein n=1 Tax=Caenorhabditis bovis TaxID=2654633 RepID=A0A8S1FBW0_9PELO|nr:unnamed protein product [Caenorhabditis bovis]